MCDRVVPDPVMDFFPGDREYQRIPYDVVFLGDSVYGLCRDETSIAAKLQEKTGLKCYNGGLGGTVLGRADTERRLGYTKDSLSAAGLVRSFAVKDFGVQKTIRIREAATDYLKIRWVTWDRSILIRYRFCLSDPD